MYKGALGQVFLRAVDFSTGARHRGRRVGLVKPGVAFGAGETAGEPVGSIRRITKVCCQEGERSRGHNAQRQTQNVASHYPILVHFLADVGPPKLVDLPAHVINLLMGVRTSTRSELSTSQPIPGQGYERRPRREW